MARPTSMCVCVLYIYMYIYIYVCVCGCFLKLCGCVRVLACPCLLRLVSVKQRLVRWQSLAPMAGISNCPQPRKCQFGVWSFQKAMNISQKLVGAVPRESP